MGILNVKSWTYLDLHHSFWHVSTLTKQDLLHKVFYRNLVLIMNKYIPL
jgi:hypothetical protein